MCWVIVLLENPWPVTETELSDTGQDVSLHRTFSQKHCCLSKCYLANSSLAFLCSLSAAESSMEPTVTKNSEQWSDQTLLYLDLGLQLSLSFYFFIYFLSSSQTNLSFAFSAPCSVSTVISNWRVTWVLWVLCLWKAPNKLICLYYNLNIQVSSGIVVSSIEFDYYKTSGVNIIRVCATSLYCIVQM